MAEGKPEAYEGDRPYIFADYAHADRDAVLPIIRALVDEGYRVWYDDGIELTADYPEHIADRVLRCASFVMFVSRASLASQWCRAEVNYALDLKKERILPIYLEDVELTPGLQMRLGRRQAINWYEYGSDEGFYGKLFKARRIEACLTDEGRRRRGSKPRLSSFRDTGLYPIAHSTIGDASGDSFAKETPSVNELTFEEEGLLLNLWDFLKSKKELVAHEVYDKDAFGGYEWTELKSYLQYDRAYGH